MKKSYLLLLSLLIVLFSISPTFYAFAEEVSQEVSNEEISTNITQEETTTVSEQEENTTTEFIFDEAKYGDINNDGKLSAADARHLLRCSVELEEITDYIIAYGDFNKDEKITADDARTSLRISVMLDNVTCLLHGHTFYDIITVGTCISEGYTTKKCSLCEFYDETKTDIQPFQGHNFTTIETSADCENNGTRKTICTVCSHIETEEIIEAAFGHKYGIWQLNGATKTKTCKICLHEETAENVKTIYLTFDDGPGAYTEKLLGYLREYGVKATFFVTNQFPKYADVLTQMAADGHAIGVHSLTHDWSIYSNQESYLNDFNAMHQIIKEKTGIDTKIFRFPGGTNNTVSRSYSKGIMAAMANIMTEAGYSYFDWNVDSGDTRGYNSSQIASTTINQISNKHTSVVLMHDIKNSTVEAIKTIIQYGLNNGFKFDVLDESTPPVRFSPAN